MYYPFLRAKQYELKALREFAQEHSKQNVITPILEPVKQQINALTLAVCDLIGQEMNFALILNPKDGDFKHTTVHFDVLNGSIPQLLNEKEKWIPAFLYNRDNVKDIRDLVSKYDLTNVMIIFRTCVDPDDNKAMSLIKETYVSYIVNAFGTTVSRRIKRLLDETNKNIIRIDDCFHTQKNNSDYSIITDEFFTEEVFYYNGDELFHGFSDFTVLPKDFTDGGMLPKAIAIHLTYKKNEDQIYVHHFVSDSNETRNDIPLKFREAALKVKSFFQDKDITKSVQETIQRADQSNGYPGLGYIKKLSIKNHLELVLHILES